MEKRGYEVGQYYCVDLVKFICSILVVMIHVAPFGVNNNVYTLFNYGIQHYLARIAVPFFFVPQGVFCSKNYRCLMFV